MTCPSSTSIPLTNIPSKLSDFYFKNITMDKADTSSSITVLESSNVENIQF